MEFPGSVEKSNGLLVQINCRRMLSPGIESVCLGAQSSGQSTFVVELASDAERGVGQAQRLLHIHADLLSYPLREGGDKVRTKQRPVTRQKRRSPGVVVKSQQLFQ